MAQYKRSASIFLFCKHNSIHAITFENKGQLQAALEVNIMMKYKVIQVVCNLIFYVLVIHSGNPT